MLACGRVETSAAIPPGPARAITVGVAGRLAWRGRGRWAMEPIYKGDHFLEFKSKSIFYLQLVESVDVKHRYKGPAVCKKQRGLPLRLPKRIQQSSHALLVGRFLSSY